MSEFRFSPRPNRAHEIAWMPWSAAAFARARDESKPVLLSISAVWCHWCHVMDETSYSDPEVIATINDRFVAVRVDNDRRPDVNARYNMGGWPTTAFLMPDGQTLTGATYLPPPQMRRALDEIARFFAERKDEIPAGGDAIERPPAREDAPLNDAPIRALVEHLTGAYDAQYGGFGTEPKFPQSEALDFLFTQWRYDGDPQLYEIVARSVRGMSRGGMYDHVEGGFFRYSTTRDWSVPHFEKMAEDHAGLLRLLAALLFYVPTGEVRTTLVSATNYVRALLYDPQRRLFFGSQDADEEYYALPLPERRARGAPFVDRTSYTNWTCALAGALCWVALALDDDALLREACAVLDAVEAALSAGGTTLFHVLAPGGAPDVDDLLTDRVAYLRALLDAHEIAGEPRFLQRARRIADAMLSAFAATGGGFYDRVPEAQPLGRLALRDRPIGENGLAAEALLRLAALTGEERYRAAALAVLRGLAGGAAAASTFGAAYARALRRALGPRITLRAVGEPAATAPFREAGLRLPAPSIAIRTLAPDEAAAQGLDATRPAAYLCAGTTCAAPVYDAAELRRAYEALPVPAAP